MAGLARALADRGIEVVYVAEELMSETRLRQGWVLPDLGSARLELAPTQKAVRSLIKKASPHTVHITQGLRGNGLIGYAQRLLSQRAARTWVVMETVDDHGLMGFFKRLEYKRLRTQWENKIEGVLAIGHQTGDWIAKRGYSSHRIFPFAYFLPTSSKTICSSDNLSNTFRFIFVGQFIRRKRLDLLISSLARLNHENFELTVIGSGPLENVLHSAADKALHTRVKWVGRLPIDKVQELMMHADCLVLPSRHDGWGAVVSETLIVGTPAICSDACGSAVIVQASGVGGVFPSGDGVALSQQLMEALERGSINQDSRNKLAEWAKCLGAEEGAEYLFSIIQYFQNGGTKPSAPWCK